MLVLSCIGDYVHFQGLDREIMCCGKSLSTSFWRVPLPHTIVISVTKRLVCTDSCFSALQLGLALSLMSKISINPSTILWALICIQPIVNFSGLCLNTKNSVGKNKPSTAVKEIPTINFLGKAGKDCTLPDQGLKERPGFRWLRKRTLNYTVIMSLWKEATHQRQLRIWRGMLFEFLLPFSVNILIFRGISVMYSNKVCHYSLPDPFVWHYVGHSRQRQVLERGTLTCD